MKKRFLLLFLLCGPVCADQRTMAGSQSVAIASDQSPLYVIRGVVPTATQTPTYTSTFTYTPTGSATPTYTKTFTYTFTATFTPTNTLPYGTNTYTPVATRTPTPTYTSTPTYTPTGSNTPTYTSTPTYTPTNTPIATPTLPPIDGNFIAQTGTVSLNTGIPGSSTAITLTGNYKYVSVSFNNAGLQPAIFAATSTPVYAIQVSDDGTNYSNQSTLNVLNATAAYFNQGTSPGPIGYVRINSAGVLPTTTVTPVVFTYKVQN